MDPIHQWLTSRDEEELPSGEQKFVKAAEGDTLVQDEPNNDDRSGWVLSRKVKIFFAAADIGNSPLPIFVRSVAKVLPKVLFWICQFCCGSDFWFYFD